MNMGLQWYLLGLDTLNINSKNLIKIKAGLILILFFVYYTLIHLK